MLRNAPVLASAALLLLTGALRAQVNETWSIPADYSSAQSRFAVDANGRVATAGEIQVPGAGFDVRITVRNAVGLVDWSTTFNAFGDERLQCMGVDSAGNFVFGVTSSDVFVNQLGGFLLKYDSNGALLWSRNLGQSFMPTLLHFAANGDITVAGSTNPLIATGNENMRMARYDAAGNLLWPASTDGPTQYFAFPASMAVDSSGAVVVCGKSTSGVSNTDSTVARFDANGVLSWVRTLSGPGTGYEGAEDVALDVAGNAYVGGFKAVGASVFDGYVWKLDLAGNTQWIDTVPSASVYDIAIDPRGDIYSVVFFFGAPSGGTYALRKYDAAGTILWERTRTMAYAVGVELDGAGEALVFGTDSNNVAQAPFVTRYDRNGVERWTHTHSAASGAGESFIALHVTPQDSLYSLAQGGPPHVDRWDPTVTQFCFGDGSGTACPCGNASAVGDRAGCKNSFGAAARLVDIGVASLASDSLQLNVTGVSNSFVTYFQGANASASTAFGDGLRCISGTTIRIGTRLAQNQTYTYPSAGDTSIALRGQVLVPGVRQYQVLYRNSASFCTSATFNLSNALRVEWAP